MHLFMGGMSRHHVTDRWERRRWCQDAARENLSLACDFSPPLLAEAPLQIPKTRCIGFVQAGLCSGPAPHEALLYSVANWTKLYYDSME